LSIPNVDEILSIVSSYFTIRGFNQSPNIFQIEISETNLAEKFCLFVQEIGPKNLIARLESNFGRTYLLISRLNPPKVRRSWIPRVLFFATISTVMIDGYYRAVATNSIVKVGDPIYISFLYTVSLIGILGIHELGHMIAAKKHKLTISWPYFIPGIPILGFIPTFGALIMSRGIIINRNILFDVGISGPIAGLIVTLIVSTYGASISPMIAGSEAQELSSQSGLIELHSSIFMDGTIAIVGKHVPNQNLIMSPILLAAWFGFLITFLNLLPAWQLDGGHIARATFGFRWHRILTFATIGLLACSGYYIMALFVLMFSIRSPDFKPLDDVSPLSKKRKKMFALVIALAFLCAPLPFSILPN
jgi:membrane-associated protease RseP (regulator of RpoE activity)